MSAFLDKLSNELIHLIIVQLEVFDLHSLLLSCHTLNDFIIGNKLLHKELYLSRYDDPSRGSEPDWEEQLHQNVKLEKLLQSREKDEKRSSIGFAAARVRFLMETAEKDADESRNVELLNGYFDDTDGVENRDVFLCSSGLFDNGGTNAQQSAPTRETRQLSAQLHCLWGRPIDPVPYTRLSSRFGSIRLPRDFLIRGDSPAMNTRQQNPDDIPVHMIARGKVYDLAEYTLPSLWGPFVDDGSHRTDWEKMEAIMVVLGFNLAKFTHRSDGRFPYVWRHTWAGATPQSFISPPSPPSNDESDAEPSPTSFFDQLLGDFDAEQTRLMKQPDPSLEALDPYGVTGTWMRVVCFLDYNDLYHYNFHSELGTHEELEDGRRRRRPIDTEEGIILLAECVRIPIFFERVC